MLQRTDEEPLRRFGNVDKVDEERIVQRVALSSAGKKSCGKNLKRLEGDCERGFVVREA